MKTTLLFFVMLFSALLIHAQQGFNYKAIITDNGTALQNQTVNVRFEVLENGTILKYRETHTTTTDENGIVVLTIGKGTINGGGFSKIDWTKEQYLNIQIDTGDGYVNYGTTAFNSVPYAKYSEKAGEVSYSDITSIPADIADGDDILTETQVVNIIEDHWPIVEDDRAIITNANIFIGDETGKQYTSTTEGGNVIIGNKAFKYNETGLNNTVVGDRAGLTMTGSDNVFIGQHAGSSNKGSGNVFIGSEAGRNAGYSEFDNSLIIANGPDNDEILIQGSFPDDEHDNIGSVNVRGDLLVDGELNRFGNGFGDTHTNMIPYIYGYVKSDGTIETTSSSEGFTTFHGVGALKGWYEITFDTPFDHYYEYIVMISRYSSGFGYAERYADHFRVLTTDGSGSSADRSFSFVVYKK